MARAITPSVTALCNLRSLVFNWLLSVGGYGVAPLGHEPANAATADCGDHHIYGPEGWEPATVCRRGPIGMGVPPYRGGGLRWRQEVRTCSRQRSRRAQLPPRLETVRTAPASNFSLHVNAPESCPVPRAFSEKLVNKNDPSVGLARPELPHRPAPKPGLRRLRQTLRGPARPDRCRAACSSSWTRRTTPRTKNTVGLAVNQHAGLVLVEPLTAARNAAASAGVRNRAVEGGIVRPRLTRSGGTW